MQICNSMMSSQAFLGERCSSIPLCSHACRMIQGSSPGLFKTFISICVHFFVKNCLKIILLIFLHQPFYLPPCLVNTLVFALSIANVGQKRCCMYIICANHIVIFKIIFHENVGFVLAWYILLFSVLFAHIKFAFSVWTPDF